MITDGIPFVIDNSSAAIISNKRRIFTEQFKPMVFTLETAECLTTTKQLVGTLPILLTNDSNEHHIYKIT